MSGKVDLVKILDSIENIGCKVGLYNGVASFTDNAVVAYLSSSVHNEYDLVCIGNEDGNSVSEYTIKELQSKIDAMECLKENRDIILCMTSNKIFELISSNNSVTNKMIESLKSMRDNIKGADNIKVLSMLFQIEPKDNKELYKSKKYGLTDETITIFGSKLHRIVALKSFGSIERGMRGGYIESEENLSQDGLCWVDGNAKVYEDARVEGNAYIGGRAEVFNNAVVKDQARIFDEVKVYGDANVVGSADIWGKALVFDNAIVGGGVVIDGSVTICGEAEVIGDVKIEEPITIGGEASICTKENYTSWKLSNGIAAIYRQRNGELGASYLEFNGTINGLKKYLIKEVNKYVDNKVVEFLDKSFLY